MSSDLQAQEMGTVSGPMSLRESMSGFEVADDIPSLSPVEGRAWIDL